MDTKNPTPVLHDVQGSHDRHPGPTKMPKPPKCFSCLTRVKMRVSPDKICSGGFSWSGDNPQWLREYDGAMSCRLTGAIPEASAPEFVQSVLMINHLLDFGGPGTDSRDSDAIHM